MALMWCVWIAALLRYVWCAGRSWQRLKAPSQAALADWIVLLLAPLPFSPWLEPYHFVPLFVAAILFLLTALGENVMREDRLAALAPLALMLCFVIIKIPFDVRGLGLSALLLICVVSLGCLRQRAQRRTAWQEEV
ncbi:MAG: hypothetical protein K9N21_03260 [Deltaproteobacteria bacterium]|nr:hypothetical protein [Deltaproteobacteria bacterium]